MAAVKSKGMDELLKEMNRMPLFMTTLDETDGEGGENIALEAIKAIAYEGTRAEVAENFREQGNECARAKQWNDAKQFYDKALAALKGPQTDPGPDQEASGSSQAELNEEEEAAKEKKTEEACFVNRALCNLEKSEWSWSLHSRHHQSRIGRRSETGNHNHQMNHSHPLVMFLLAYLHMTDLP